MTPDDDDIPGPGPEAGAACAEPGRTGEAPAEEPGSEEAHREEARAEGVHADERHAEPDSGEEGEADAALAEAVARLGGASAPRRRQGRAVAALVVAGSVVAHAAVLAAGLLVAATLPYKAAGPHRASGGAAESAFADRADPIQGSASAPPIPAPPDAPPLAFGARPAAGVNDGQAEAAEAGPPAAMAAPAPDGPVREDDLPAPTVIPPGATSFEMAPSFPNKKLVFSNAIAEGSALPAAVNAGPPAAAPAAPGVGAQPAAPGAATHVSTPARIAGDGLANREGYDERGLPVPEYPAESRRRREHGVIELEVEVLPDGTVGSVKATRDPGFPRLVRAAVDAARRGRYATASLDGRPVVGHVSVTYRFVLQ